MDVTDTSGRLLGATPSTSWQFDHHCPCRQITECIPAKSLIYIPMGTSAVGTAHETPELLGQNHHSLLGMMIDSTAGCAHYYIIALDAGECRLTGLCTVHR